MRIETNSELSHAAKLKAPTPPQKTPAKPNNTVNDNKVDLAKTDSLNSALKAMPAVRTERVVRARALIQDPGYPSDKVVGQVAAVLAKHIRGKE